MLHLIPQKKHQTSKCSVIVKEFFFIFRKIRAIIPNNRKYSEYSEKSALIFLNELKMNNWMPWPNILWFI